MSLNVAILGCGPTGLLAAHAAQINGCSFDIWSRKVKSPLFGSQYLHEPITGITGMPVTVQYVLEGSPQEYRHKVYGHKWDGTISAEDLEDEHSAWDIRAAYRELWARYEGEIHDCEITSESQIYIKAKLSSYDLVLSTIPRTVFANDTDQFLSSRIYAIGDAPDVGQIVPFTLAEDNVVICNADKVPSWYRLSKVFGYTTIEWPGWKGRPPVEGVRAVTKPLRCETTSAPDFLHLGRYGKWEKGVLTTDAFNEALEATAPVPSKVQA